MHSHLEYLFQVAQGQNGRTQPFIRILCAWFSEPSQQWRICRKHGARVSQGQAIKLFQALEKLVLPSILTQVFHP